MLLPAPNSKVKVGGLDREGWGKGPFAALKCSYLFTHPVKWDRHTQYGILKT